MRIACAQLEVKFGDPASNIAEAIRRLEKLKKDQVDLVVFPEAFLTGYCVQDAGQARGISIRRGELAPLQEACDRLDIVTIVGFAEQAHDHTFNSAALIEPGRAPRFYRKSHLPELGLDKFVARGDELEVFDTRLGRIGILICFDLRFPEPSRVLTLKGAELIVLPTNWPEGAETSALHVAIARAAENRVFVATCNRVGAENGFRFIGYSKIIGPSGKVLAAATDGEEIITADIDLAEARTKRNVTIPGKYETEVIESRRPELYEILIEPVATPSRHREAAGIGSG